MKWISVVVGLAVLVAPCAASGPGRAAKRAAHSPPVVITEIEGVVTQPQPLLNARLLRIVLCPDTAFAEWAADRLRAFTNAPPRVGEITILGNSVFINGVPQK